MRTTTQPPPPSSGQPSRRQLGGRETSPKSTDPPSRSSFHQQPTSPSRYSCRRGGERQRQEIRTSDTYSLCLLATRRPPLPRPSRVPVSLLIVAPGCWTGRRSEEEWPSTPTASGGAQLTCLCGRRGPRAHGHERAASRRHSACKAGLVLHASPGPERPPPQTTPPVRAASGPMGPVRTWSPAWTWRPLGDMGQPKGLPVCPSSASWCVETEFMLQSLGPGGNPTQRRDSDGDTALLASQLPSLIRRGLRQASSYSSPDSGH